MPRIRTILYPTDGSPTAEAAARFAEDIARPQGAKILVLGIVRRAFVGSVENEKLTRAVTTSVREMVEVEAAKLNQTGVSAEPLIVLADSEHAGILDVAADRNVDMIVMGTHGSSALARTVLGSVADRVVRHADVPILLVPPVEG
ncbi:MAG: universal stress protein [Coriobacteriia bacterium]|jgi:nucleotide-binding universal stress UspA family protein|nr:universal stress protein [Coriobacteriia bacterium]